MGTSGTQEQVQLPGGNGLVIIDITPLSPSLKDCPTGNYDDDDDIGAIEWRLVIGCDCWCDTYNNNTNNDDHDDDNYHDYHE